MAIKAPGLGIDGHDGTAREDDLRLPRDKTEVEPHAPPRRDLRGPCLGNGRSVKAKLRTWIVKAGRENKAQPKQKPAKVKEVWNK